MISSCLLMYEALYLGASYFVYLLKTTVHLDRYEYSLSLPIEIIIGQTVLITTCKLYMCVRSKGCGLQEVHRIVPMWWSCLHDIGRSKHWFSATSTYYDALLVSCYNSRLLGEVIMYARTSYGGGQVNCIKLISTAYIFTVNPYLGYCHRCLGANNGFYSSQHLV